MKHNFIHNKGISLSRAIQIGREGISSYISFIKGGAYYGAIKIDPSVGLRKANRYKLEPVKFSEKASMAPNFYNRRNELCFNWCKYCGDNHSISDLATCCSRAFSDAVNYCE